MNLKQLRVHARGYLDDPRGMTWNNARLDPLLDEAYQDTLTELRLMRQAHGLNTQDKRTTITTNDTVREYIVEPADGVDTDVDTIHEVCEEFEDGTFSPPLHIVHFDMRNAVVDGVYLFQADKATPSGGLAWHLGVCRFPAQYPKIAVWYTKRITFAIGQFGDVVYPLGVPDEFHHLIGYRTAFLGKVQESRDGAGMAALWVEGLNRMRRFIKAKREPMRARRLGSGRIRGALRT